MESVGALNAALPAHPDIGGNGLRSIGIEEL
jgi:hypothetical protein